MEREQECCASLLLLSFLFFFLFCVECFARLIKELLLRLILSYLTAISSTPAAAVLIGQEFLTLFLRNKKKNIPPKSEEVKKEKFISIVDQNVVNY